MKNQSKYKNSFKIIFVFILVILLIIFNPYNFFAPVRDFTYSVFMPVVQFGYRSGNKISDIVGTVKSIGTLKSENENLYEENLGLKSKINELKDIINENESLRKDLNIKEKEGLNLAGAEVVLKDISGKNGWIGINLGKNDGIEVGMPILVGEKNLVGFVEEVFENYSRVNLINNPESLINVVTVESNVEAIAKGDHGISILVDKINQDADIKAGMTFVTSQISGKLPRGFTVGVVQSIFDSPDGLFKNARITPLVDFNKIRFVYVLKK